MTIYASADQQALVITKSTKQIVLNDNTVIEKFKKLKKFIEKNTEDVGKNFTEEARKIHYGESDPKPIRGETTREQAEELLEEGVPIARLPWTSKEDA